MSIRQINNKIRLWNAYVLRYTCSDEKVFEIVCNRRKVLEYRNGLIENKDISQVLQSQIIYSRVCCDEVAKPADLYHAFRTIDVLHIASIILRKGSMVNTSDLSVNSVSTSMLNSFRKLQSSSSSIQPYWDHSESEGFSVKEIRQRTLSPSRTITTWRPTEVEWKKDNVVSSTTSINLSSNNEIDCSETDEFDDDDSSFMTFVTDVKMSEMEVHTDDEFDDGESFGLEDDSVMTFAEDVRCMKRKRNQL